MGEACAPACPTLGALGGHSISLLDGGSQRPREAVQMGQAPGPPLPSRSLCLRRAPVHDSTGRGQCGHRWALGMCSVHACGLRAEACAHTHPPCACAWVCGSPLRCLVGVHRAARRPLGGANIPEWQVCSRDGDAPGSRLPLPEQPSEEVTPAPARGGWPRGP